ncbi:MAG: DUF2089 family protein [Gammaproteobacteria bacterium]|nr:DUF2089 family protein [Gammaproteobacteria bacterium]
MASDWQELTKLTQGEPILVERVKLIGTDISIDSEFELPPLAQITAEDQVFVMAFVQASGSIKEMERIFGISYPTVKNRLKRIADLLPLTESAPPQTEKSQILEQLQSGDISAEEAIRRMS